MTPLRFTINRIGEPSLQELAAAKTSLDSPASVVDFWQSIIAARPDHEPDKENLVTIQLNTRLRPIGYHLVALGGLNESIAHPREILRPAILVAAHGFVLAHNHPSGDPSPSEADRRLTRRLQEASELLQLRFVDHVVVGEQNASITSHYSFREAGML